MVLDGTHCALQLEKLLERVPVPVKEGPEEPCAKVNVLLQVCMGVLLRCEVVHLC